MRTPLQITIRHMAHSHALTTRVREEVEKLSGFDPDIVSCRVVIEPRDRHKSQGRSFNVRIALGVPGHELIVNHDHDEDVYVALRDAFASLTRRLEDVAAPVWDRQEARVRVERRGDAGGSRPRLGCAVDLRIARWQGEGAVRRRLQRAQSSDRDRCLWMGLTETL